MARDEELKKRWEEVVQKLSSHAREVSLIYHKSELKIQITEALHTIISGIIRGAIAFQNVQIISPIVK